MRRDILAEAIAIREGRSLSVPTHEHVEVLLGTLEALMGFEDYQLMRDMHQPIEQKIVCRMAQAEA